MEFSVTRNYEGLVAPSGSTPSGALELSVIDRLPALRCNVPSVYVFKQGGPEAAKVIREALSKVLIYYYPLAGRLQFSELNELQVDCCGDGAWFVEASADCTLDAVNYFDDANLVPYDKLLPPLQENVDDPLVQMQVTKFGCNGFVVGLKTSHVICDGLGTAQFVNALGEVARGGSNQPPSITPVWCRNDLLEAAARATPLQSDEPLIDNNNNNTIITVDNKLEHATINLSLDRINELKQRFQESSVGVQTNYCSTFEIVSAIVWRARTRAIAMLPDETTKLVFYANCRHLIPQLPKSGFYGNCFYPVSVTMPSGVLANMSVFRVVKLIQEAKARMPNEFQKYLTMLSIKKDYQEVDPYLPSLDYRTMCVSDWNGLGFKEVDYGWGKPVNVVPVHGNSSAIFPIVVMCSPCQAIPKRGVLRLMTWCVQQKHLEPLLSNINDNNIIVQ